MQLVPVLGHGAAGEGAALGGHELTELLVGQGLFLVLPGDKLLQQRLGRVGGGGLVACGGAQAAGEKVAQGIHAHGALDILLLYRPAHCGLVDADALGHVGQGQGNQVAGPLAEKGLLEFQNTLGARHEGGAALLDGLDHPLGLAHLAGQIVLHLAVVTLLH